MSSDSDSNGSGDKVPEKKAKKEPEKKKSSQKKRRHESDEEEEGDEGKWELGPKRYISVSEFKGKTRVDIREFYATPDGEEKPTKKGISLSGEQWEKLKSLIPKIDAKMKE